MSDEKDKKAADAAYGLREFGEDAAAVAVSLTPVGMFIPPVPGQTGFLNRVNQVRMGMARGTVGLIAGLPDAVNFLTGKNLYNGSVADWADKKIEDLSKQAGLGPTSSRDENLVSAGKAVPFVASLFVGGAGAVSKVGKVGQAAEALSTVQKAGTVVETAGAAASQASKAGGLLSSVFSRVGGWMGSGTQAASKVSLAEAQIAATAKVAGDVLPVSLRIAKAFETASIYSQNAPTVVSVPLRAGFGYASHWLRHPKSMAAAHGAAVGLDHYLTDGKVTQGAGYMGGLAVRGVAGTIGWVSPRLGQALLDAAPAALNLGKTASTNIAEGAGKGLESFAKGAGVPVDKLKDGGKQVVSIVASTPGASAVVGTMMAGGAKIIAGKDAVKEKIDNAGGVQGLARETFNEVRQAAGTMTSLRDMKNELVSHLGFIGAFLGFIGSMLGIDGLKNMGQRFNAFVASAKQGDLVNQGANRLGVTETVEHDRQRAPAPGMVLTPAPT